MNFGTLFFFFLNFVAVFMAPNAHELEFSIEQTCVRDNGGLVERDEEVHDHVARTFRPVTFFGLPLLVDASPREPFRPTVPLDAPAPHLFWGFARGRSIYRMILSQLRRPGPSRPQEASLHEGLGRGRGRGRGSPF